MDLKVSTKHISHLQLQNLQAIWDVRGTRVLRYTVDATNGYLRQHKNITATDLYGLTIKAQTLINNWDAKIDADLLAKRQQADKSNVVGMAQEAEAKRQALLKTLSATLKFDDRVVWESLKSTDRFVKEYFPGPRPVSPKVAPMIDRPVQRKVGLLGRLLGAKKRDDRAFRVTMLAYEDSVAKRESAAVHANDKHSQQLADYFQEVALWDAEQAAKEQAYSEVRKDQHQSVERLREAWLAGESTAIVEHATLVLDRSNYNDHFVPDFELDWIEPSRIMLVTFRLPTPEIIPKLKTARLIASTGEIKETNITDKLHADLYDGFCYQVCLRTIHELIEADEPGHIKAVVFNGVVEYIEKSTGKEVLATILSIQAQREAFLALDLSRVDPKACFKSFKGVAAASLIGLAAVPPVLRLNREDKRFIEARPINLHDQEGVNLAAMPWEEFEHLIREVFGRIFSGRGAEVKITQASRDGGVDAVAFDPDPISGGKTVIQAKRYTRTVGVSAVRDLFGTVMNEGANKGILVTTADYGPDAYAFAAGKPLTLLSGANLLHLLSQHGVQARIDLLEARQNQ